MAALDDIAADLVRRGVSSACALGCAVRRGGEWVREAGGLPDRGTFFDLASVTKPLTAVAIARSGMDRKAPLASFLPELRGTASAEVPLELFLAHRAGLAAHLPLFEPLVNGGGVDPEVALSVVANARRADAAGTPPREGFGPLYSDLGYILAGAALARFMKAADAGDAIDALVITPLGLTNEMGTARRLNARGISVGARCAPTEVVPWRGGAVVGAVHDENAWALTGEGGSGHAGLFGTIDAVLTFGSAVLDAIGELEWLARERPGGTLRAGFDGKSAEGSSAGARIGPRAFGHLGFTGTSVWIDPDAAIVIALLTNRVHPTRENILIRTARPEVHDALFARAAELARPGSPGSPESSDRRSAP